MALTMKQIDTFIDTTIKRLASEHGTLVSQFYVDLRSFQNRITNKLVNECIEICNARGLQSKRVGDGLNIVVNLQTCMLNPDQATAYNLALDYTRNHHGNHL